MLYLGHFYKAHACCKQISPLHSLCSCHWPSWCVFSKTRGVESKPAATSWSSEQNAMLLKGKWAVCSLWQAAKEIKSLLAVKPCHTVTSQPWLQHASWSPAGKGTRVRQKAIDRRRPQPLLAEILLATHPSASIILDQERYIVRVKAAPPTCWKC